MFNLFLSVYSDLRKMLKWKPWILENFPPLRCKKIDLGHLLATKWIWEGRYLVAIWNFSFLLKIQSIWKIISQLPSPEVLCRWGISRISVCCFSFSSGSGLPSYIQATRVFPSSQLSIFCIIMMICKQQVMSFKHACDDVGAEAMAIGVCMGMLETKSE